MDRDGGPRCATHVRRRRERKLAEYRVWMAEQLENEHLIEDHAPDPVDTVASAGRAIRAALSEMRGALGELDPASLDGDALMGTVLALEDTQRRLDAAKAVAIGALDNAGATEAKAGLRVKQWKANRTHSSPAAVGRELKVARTLARFAAFADALGDGLISVDHVLALAGVCNERIVDSLVDIEDRLVRFAKLHRYRLFVTHLRQVVAVLDDDGPEPDCGDRDTAAMGRDLEGHLHLSLELSGHSAVEIEAIINTETDRQYRAACREHDSAGTAVPTMCVLRARAIVELIRRGADPNPHRSHPSPSAILPIVVDGDGVPAALHTVDGEDVDRWSAAVLLCDALFHPVTVDPAGNPLNMGRSVRFFTPAQKQALAVRDGGCIFPGCEQPARRCAAHHRIEWDNGGETNVDDGALLCPRHHGLVHCGQPWVLLRWRIEDLPDDLAEQHRARAAGAGLEPATDVRVFRSPEGRLVLAQNATDHHGPAPPRRRPAA